MGNVITPKVFRQTRETNYIESLEVVNNALKKMHSFHADDCLMIEISFTRTINLLGHYARHINGQRAHNKPLTESFLKKIADLEKIIANLEKNISRDGDDHSTLLDMLEKATFN